MNALDCSSVLDRLVRTGIWSSEDFLSRHKRVVIDAESASTFLYRSCVSTHIRKQASLIPSNQPPDLYSGTLVNYRQYSRYVNQLLDFFVSSNIEPILVYEGKFVEAPIHGLTAAGFESNSKRVASSIAYLSNYAKHGRWADGSPSDHVSRPNLALNLFKSVVNIRRRSGARIQVQQAFYSALPVLVRLARDFRCPIVTNRSELIIMDVRAGFLLMDDFWSTYVDTDNLTTSARSRSVSPKSVATKSSAKSPGRSRSTSGLHVKCKLHYNRSFLRQHPGLNPALAMDIFPLNTIDFMTKHAKSLKSANIYKDEYKEGDFYPKSTTRKAPDASVMYSKHQASANRLDMILTFLCSKTISIIGNMVRGVATKTNSSFDVDFRQIFNYYAVAYEFKQRLRFVLNYVDDPIQLNYIEWCLVNRECTSDYLLNLLCCSIGHLASVNYNRSLQFEDLLTKNSAYSSHNRGKAMLMSLFSLNKSHQGEHSLSSKREPDSITRYSTASLTVIDREHAKVVEQVVSTTHEDAELAAIRERLDLGRIASRKIAKEDSIKFINLVFRSKGLMLIDKKLESVVGRLMRNDEHVLRNELLIIMSLSTSTFSAASSGDAYFERTYTSLIHHFKIALLNQYLYLNQALSKRKQNDLTALINLVNKHDWENVTSAGAAENRAAKVSSKSPGKAKLTASVTNTQSQGHETSKRIRHLLELVNSALEAYCELNAFFDYPLPRLNLHLHYNPILIYNLTLYSLEQTKSNNNNKTLITF